jgi:hypothetical protein
VKLKKNKGVIKFTTAFYLAKFTSYTRDSTLVFVLKIKVSQSSLGPQRVQKVNFFRGGVRLILGAEFTIACPEIFNEELISFE